MILPDKASARAHAWAALAAQGLAVYPLPARGRIPNFRGARVAAERLAATKVFRAATAIKVSPDSPQRFVRALALAKGIRVYVPTPRLAGGFHLLDPAAIAATDHWRAADRHHWGPFAEPVPLDSLPPFDLIVAGSVAVTAAGKRAGKGAGYSDLEFAILREIGHPPAPVATTVHDCQVVGDFPAAPHDQPLSLIATPTRTISIDAPLPAPAGIDWAAVPAEAFAAMPLLAELRARKSADEARARTE
jgi:5-formyltetrahydrofolate cyclo-ligase